MSKKLSKNIYRRLKKPGSFSPPNPTQRGSKLFILANFLRASADILGMILNALELVIVIRVILSWANADSFNGFVRAIYAFSDPLLSPFRKLLPPWRLHGWDLSPFFALLALIFAQKFILPTLYGIASRL